MKSDIHPENYRMVIFQDAAADTSFLIGSTVETEETGTWTDGNEYPLFKIEISSASHPFYTGTEKIMDTGGRVDRFKKRLEAAAAAPVKKKTAAPAEDKKEEVTETVVEEPAAEVTETVEEVVDAPAETTEPTEEEKE